jgi:hypothetical protein
MNARVRRDNDVYWVWLTLDGVDVECAGPFDDESDAIAMAERSVYGGGEVELAYEVEHKHTRGPVKNGIRPD